LLAKSKKNSSEREIGKPKYTNNAWSNKRIRERSARSTKRIFKRRKSSGFISNSYCISKNTS
jgi:hypothetical protein